MKKLFLFLITISINLLGLSDQEVLTFKDAIEIALKRNHQIEIARNNTVIARNNAHIGKADLLPEVNFSGGTTFQNGQSTFETSGSNTTSNIQLQASYTLFDGLGNIYRYKKLRSEGRMGELESRDRIESTLLQVSEAYYTAASSYENLQIAQELLSISKERLDRAKKRSAYGRARTIDVLSAQVDLKSDQVTVTQAKFRWDEARRNLNVLLNRKIDTNFNIETTVDFIKNMELNTLKSGAFLYNASLLSSEESIKVARYELGIARANFLPRLDLMTSYGYSQTSSGWHVGLKGADTTFRIGATFSLNLFNGFKTFIQNKNARITLNSQKLAVAQARLNLERDVTSFYESYKNSLLVLELEKQHVEAASLNFKRTQELYNLGQVTTTQFREAQLNLIQARSNLSTSKYEAKLKEIELLRLSGQLIK